MRSDSSRNSYLEIWYYIVVIRPVSVVFSVAVLLDRRNWIVLVTENLHIELSKAVGENRFSCLHHIRMRFVHRLRLANPHQSVSTSAIR